MKRKLMIFGILMVVMFGFAITAQAIPYGFERITANSSQDVAAQLLVEVTDPGSGSVQFYFTNSGPVASSIADIYFDDGSLLGIASITNGTGVSFSQGATPSNLPGGNNAVPPFVTTAGFSADSDSPVEENGVNPGENVAIIFNLQDGKTFNDVISELNSGALRVGMHVQAIGTDGKSDGYVNDGFKVPEPGILLLLGAGLLGLWVLRRRK